MAISKQLIWQFGIGLCVALATSSCYAAAPQEKESDSDAVVTLKQVPQTAREAIKLATKEGKVSKIVKENENGTTLFEATVAVEGGVVDLSFNEQGQLVDVEVVEGPNGKASDQAKGKEADEADEAGEAKEADEANEANESDEANEANEADEADEGKEANESGEVSKRISIEKLSEAAHRAIKKQSDGAELVGVEAVTEGGITVFEAAWKRDKVTHEVTVSVDGEVLSNEKSLMLEQLPPSVRKTAKRFAGSSEPKLEQKTVVLYEVEIEKNGHDVEILVDPAGREIHMSIAPDKQNHRSNQ